jgi:hypothetical protein
LCIQSASPAVEVQHTKQLVSSITQLLAIDKTNLFQKRKKIILYQAKSLPKLSKPNIWQLPNNTQPLLKIGPQEIRQRVDLYSVNLIPPKRSSLEMRVDGRFYQTRSSNLGIHLHPKIKMSDCKKTINLVMKVFLDQYSLLNRFTF